MSIALRFAAADDLAALARLHALCFPLDAWDEAALADILVMRGAHARVAVAPDGRPLGFLFDVLHDDAEAEILTLGVHPVERRRGIARALLADLFARGATAGLDAAVLEVAADNAAGLALYRSCGFHAVGRRRGYYRRGGAAVDAWLLRRSLAR